MLVVDFGGVKLRNPFVIGAGPYSCSADVILKNLDRIADAGWGGVVLKSICCDEKLTQEHYGAQPHIFPVIGKNGLMGMQNYGPYFTYWPNIDLRKVLKVGKELGLLIIPSVIAENIGDWVYLASQVEECGAEIVELDLSCPCSPENVSKGEAAHIDLSPQLAEEVVSAVKGKCHHIPVIAKLGPNLFDLTPVAKAVEKGGASGITAVNTLLGLTGIDIETGIPLCASANDRAIFSGLSGEIIRPVGLRCVAQVAQSVKLPVFGVGGISTWQSAVEYLMVGATALEVVTAVMLHGFGVVRNLLEGLTRFMERKGYNSIKDFRGISLKYITGDFFQLNRKALIATVDEERCSACGLCVIACTDGSAGAITLVDEQVIIDKNLCIGCGLCKTVCPLNTLELVFKSSS